MPWLKNTDGTGTARHLPVDGAVTRCVWRPDGQRLLVQTDLSGTEDNQLAEVDPATGTVDWITHERAARHEIGVDIEGAAVSGDGRRLVWGVNEDGYTHLNWLDLDSGRRGEVDGLPAGVTVMEWGYDGYSLYPSTDGRRVVVLLGRATAAA